MATTFAALGAYEVSSKVEALLHVLDVADHVLQPKKSACRLAIKDAGRGITHHVEYSISV
jgi:predicted alpha/beta-hydrolase family hydrolase